MLSMLIGRQLAAAIVRPALGQVSAQRYIATTINLQKIFTIQSVEDFDERVRKNKTPIVVDFYAT